jgi:hypothetical protein
MREYALRSVIRFSGLMPIYDPPRGTEVIIELDAIMVGARVSGVAASILAALTESAAL